MFMQHHRVKFKSVNLAALNNIYFFYNVGGYPGAPPTGGYPAPGGYPQQPPAAGGYGQPPPTGYGQPPPPQQGYQQLPPS